MPHPTTSLPDIVTRKGVGAGLACLLVALLLVPAQAPAQVDDNDVPHGVAGDWIVGHRLLLEGKTADALPYLHMAYRALPEVPRIAMDFQAALAAEGYLRDALNVVDQLVAAHPDSVSFRLRRSALNLQAGNEDKALSDLRLLRDRGHTTPEVLGAEARILASRGDIEQALDVLRDGLHLHPESATFLYLDMSRILQQAGRMEAIPDLMTEARGRYPDEPDLWLVHIRSLAALERHEEAVTLARQAELHFATLAAEPASPAGGEGSHDLEPDLLAEPAPVPGNAEPESFLVDLADFYAQRGQPQRAVDILQPLETEGALGLSPSLWLARLLLATGRVEEGAALVDRILLEWPSAGRGWFLKAKVSESNDDWATAIEHYRRAVELEPYDPEIRLGIIRAMLLSWERDLRLPAGNPERDRKMEEFRGHATIATTLVADADVEGQLLMGYAFRAIGDLERAAWRFELAAEDPGLRLTALIQRSICLDELGQVGRARTVLETLRREYPDDPEVANSYGYFLAEKDSDLDLAEGLIQEALAAQPDNGAFLDSMGWVMYRQGKLESALDFMIQAVNVLPDDPIILEHLGIVFRDLGQTSQARETLARALAVGGEPERLEPLIQSLDEGPAEAEQ